MKDKTQAFWDRQDQRKGDRLRLFQAVSAAFPAYKVLYAGSFVDVAPSFVYDDVTYADMDNRAAAFFADSDGVQQIIREHGGSANAQVRFLHGGYRSLALREPSFDLLISLHAGFISEACGHYPGIEMARGFAIAVIVDGARMASPGLVAWTLKALETDENPLIGALSWHLGPDVQNVSMLDGYNQASEDALLQDIDWPGDGYRLFDISTLAQSSKCGFLGGVPPELSWFCMTATSLAELGGYDPDFVSPGGGLVNHDMLLRALACPSVSPIMLLGEGLFHQFHGGVATNVPMSDHPLPGFQEEYVRLRGQRYRRTPVNDAHYIGAMPDAARRFIVKS